MNASVSFVTNMAPNYVRTSFTMWHSGYALGEAAAKTLHAKTAVVAYTDYPPGKDSLEAFRTSFEANGGKVIDAIPSGGPGAVPSVTLSAERGHPVVLAFFPAAFSGTCTKELCTFRDNLATLNSAKAKVYGISVDTFFTLKAFQTDQKLNFSLLSDFNKQVIRDYGAFNEDMIGLKGIVMKSHGGADALAFCNALKKAHAEVTQGVLERITLRLAEMPVPASAGNGHAAPAAAAASDV